MSTVEKKVAQENGHDDQLPYIFSMTAKDSMDQPVEAEVRGTIPTWLSGSLYRNGSGLYKVGETSWNHLFDGFAILHRWTIQNGRVSFQSTVLDSDQYRKSRAVNRLVGGGFATRFPDPCKSIFHRFFSRFLPLPPDISDNTGVHIVEIGDRLFALTETTAINEIDPKTLLCIGKTDVRDSLALHIGTAHPHFEKDGTVLYYGTNMSYKQAYNIVRATPPKNNEALMKDARIIASIPSRWKMNIGYNHSFGMSENYLIVMELPFAVNLPKILTMSMRNTSVADAMETYPNEKILIHVVEKKTGKHLPVTFQAPHGFVFHFINCYEEGNHLIVDVCLSDAAIIKDLYLASLVNNDMTVNFSCFARFVLPLSIDGAKIGDNVNHLPGSKAKAEVISESIVEVEAEKLFGPLCFDLPRINYDLVNGTKYRYVYGTTLFTSDTDRKVLKLDVVDKTVKEWTCESIYEPGEPVFIPSPHATKEDDGIVLCPVVSKLAENKSYLLILDASTFEELATSSVPVDVKMNVTFHGNFTSKVF